MTTQRPFAAALRRCALALCIATALTSLRAQTAPAAPPSPVDPTSKGEAVLLTPFQVSTDKDRGYFGGSTLAGGRADTPLKITPGSISVMTKEFLEDFDLTDMNQALAWTVGADAPTGGESGAFGGNRFQTSFRGVDGNGNFPVRNGSINYYVADTYNSERYDFSRGPNAALFGDGGPGGLQGSSSKQARLKNVSTTASTRLDSFGGYRATIDTNYGLDQAAVRLNLLHQNVKAYQDGTSNKQNGFTAAFTYKIAERTQFRAEIQRDAEKNVAYRRFYAEQASRWDGTTTNTNNTAIANFANFGLTQISATQDYQVWNFGTNSLINYKGERVLKAGPSMPVEVQGLDGVPQAGDKFDIVKDEKTAEDYKMSAWGATINTNSGVLGGFVYRSSKSIGNWGIHPVRRYFAIEAINIKHPKEKTNNQFTAGAIFNKENYFFVIHLIIYSFHKR